MSTEDFGTEVLRTALPEDLADEIRRCVSQEAGFMRLTIVQRQGGQLRRNALRPVQIKGAKNLQWEGHDGKRTLVRNLDDQAASEVLETLLAQTGPRELHLVTVSGDLHIRITRKGKALVSRSKPLQRDINTAMPHDRVKQQPLTAFDSAPLLKAIGIMDVDNRIKASMRGKYDQVNEFLRIIDTVASGTKAWRIVDCGCGRAYLTFAVHAYLKYVHQATVQMYGIERNPELIATARQLALDLDVGDEVHFIESDLETCQLDFKPDLLLSLHACDTATDEALARGVEWQCRHIICAPCCQHELHTQLKNANAMRAVARHGILRERLADLLTDTFRAQILRMLGYRVKVIEFVAPEATARNLLLKAEAGVAPGQATAVAEYLELRDFWKVTPWLEARLRKVLEQTIPNFPG